MSAIAMVSRFIMIERKYSKLRNRTFLISVGVYAANSSSSAFASFRSLVLNPSVNHP